MPFTLVDFVACDRRYARHFAQVPRAGWTANMLAAGQCLEREGTDSLESVPCLLMVGRDDTLQKVIVDEKMLREARRCREMWHSLQELGGIHNSHAERLLARGAHGARRAPQPATPAAVAAAEAATAATPAPAAAAAETEAPKVARRSVYRDPALHDLQRMHRYQQQDVCLQ